MAARARCRIRVAPNGAVYLGATRVVSGTETSIGSDTKVAGLTLQAATFLNLHGRVFDTSPTQLRLRAWACGGSEPSSWTVDETDSTGSLERSGEAGVRAHLASATTNAPVTFDFDNLVLTQPAVAAPTPTPAPTPQPTPAHERYLPMDPSGASDPDHGMIQFVVGTGGIGHNTIPVVRANSAVRDDTTYGVLRLTLRATGWDWLFVPVAGSSFTDAGSGSCHGAP